MRCVPPRSVSKKSSCNLPGRKRLLQKKKPRLRERANEKRLAHLAQGNAQLFCFAGRLRIDRGLRSVFWIFLLEPVASLSAIQHGSPDARRGVSDEHAGRNRAP